MISSLEQDLLILRQKKQHHKQHLLRKIMLGRSESTRTVLKRGHSPPSKRLRLILLVTIIRARQDGLQTLLSQLILGNQLFMPTERAMYTQLLVAMSMDIICSLIMLTQKVGKTCLSTNKYMKKPSTTGFVKIMVRDSPNYLEKHLQVSMQANHLNHR